jgi:hypothetical protein
MGNPKQTMAGHSALATMLEVFFNAKTTNASS